MSTVATNPSVGVSPPRSGVIEIGGTTALAAAAVLVAILITVFWDFVRTQWLSAIEHPSDWGHTLIVPAISGWFVWLRRDRILAQPFRPSWTGLVMTIAGLGAYVLALLGPSIVAHHNFRGFAIALTIGGLCVLLFGWRAAKWMIFPVLYWAVFGQSVSQVALEKVTLRLQDWAASGAYYLLNGIGFETEISGNVLSVVGSDGKSHPLNVAEACSGMRMLVAFLALGVAMAFVGLDRWWQRVILVVMGVPVAIAVNIVRVATLGLLSLGNVNMVEGEFHHFVGMLWLVPAFLMYLGIQWCLQVLAEPWVRAPAGPNGSAAPGTTAAAASAARSAPKTTPTPRAPAPADGGFFARSSIRIAYIAACATLLCGAIGFRGAVYALNAFLHKLPAPLREPLSTIPTSLGNWRSVGVDQALPDAVVEELGTKTYLSRVYALDGDMGKGWLDLHVAYYTGLIDSVPHVPERCFTASGGLLQVGPPQRLLLPVDDASWNRDGGAVNAATGERYPTAVVVDPITLRREQVNLPVGDVSITIIEFQKADQPDLRIFGGYLFVANGRLTPTALAVRELAFSLSEQYAYYCKVQFTGQYRANPAAREKYRDEVADLLGELLPHLMQRLPDWPEYEARSGSSTPPPN